MVDKSKFLKEIVYHETCVSCMLSKWKINKMCHTKSIVCSEGFMPRKSGYCKRKAEFYKSLELD